MPGAAVRWSRARTDLSRGQLAAGEDRTERTPIEDIRPDCAAHDVAPASGRIAAQQSVAAEVFFFLLRRREKFQEGLDVPKAKIEPLGADRGRDMRRLSDKSHARAPISRTASEDSGKRALSVTLETRPRARCDAFSISKAKSSSSRASRRSASFLRSTQTKLDAFPGSGTSVNGPALR